MGLEPMTFPLPRECATSAPQEHVRLFRIIASHLQAVHFVLLHKTDVHYFGALSSFNASHFHSTQNPLRHKSMVLIPFRNTIYKGLGRGGFEPPYTLVNRFTVCRL